MTAFDDLIPVTLVADAETPTDLVPFAGRVIGVPPGTALPTDGSGVFLGKFTGYARNTGSGWEWVMAPAQDQLLRAINRIPGAAGWSDLEARRVWRAAFKQLRDRGINGPELGAVVPLLYSAAVANHIAAQQAPPAP